MVYVEHTKKIDKILEYLYPIIMLLLGVAIDRILLHISEQNRIDKAGNLWIIEVENLDYSLQKQIESFKKFISTYCDIDDANDIPPMPKYEVLKCEIFNSFQKKDLYDYLKHKDAATAKDMFHKILNIISTTKDTFEQTLKYFERSIKESSLHYDAISQYLSDYGQELKLNEEKYQNCLGENYTDLINLMNSEIYDKMPNINIFRIQSSFIAPSLILMEQHNKIECAELLKILMKCQDNILALKNEKEYCKMNFLQAITISTEIIKNISALPIINKKQY